MTIAKNPTYQSLNCLSLLVYDIMVTDRPAQNQNVFHVDLRFTSYMVFAPILDLFILLSEISG